MIKCTMETGLTRYFSLNVVHSINQEEGAQSFAMVITAPDGSGPRRLRVQSFSVVKTGVSCKP